MPFRPNTAIKDAMSCKMVSEIAWHWQAQGRGRCVPAAAWGWALQGCHARRDARTPHCPGLLLLWAPAPNLFISASRSLTFECQLSQSVDLRKAGERRLNEAWIFCTRKNI